MTSGPQRTHDQLYLTAERYDEPKEMFKWIAGHADARGALAAQKTVVDFGCAAGEFLYFLSRAYPGPEYMGIDVLDVLVEKARTRSPSVSWRAGSVMEPGLLAANTIDTAFLSGVLSIFDDYRPVLDNLISWTRPAGHVFVFGAFNPHPVDVWVKYRSVDEHAESHRESGWNIFSRQSISDYLGGIDKVKDHSFHPFDLPIDLEPHPSDPVRSWTFKDEQGMRVSTNGLSLLLNLELLEIRL